MVTTDPISDMLTRIRNAVMVRHEWVDIPYSTAKFSIAKLLKEEGYLRNYKVFVDDSRMKFIKVYIGYDEHSRSVISGLKRVSKPRQAGLHEGPRRSGGARASSAPRWYLLPRVL